VAVALSVGTPHQSEASKGKDTIMALKRGGARIAVEWGYDVHEVTLTPRNWSRVKRGHNLRIRSVGYYEGASQWEYWNFGGGLNGELIVEYGNDGGQGFIGRLSDAMIEELP
jgi:hypothetical protein